MKVCKKCGVEKPISNFSKSGNQVLADGSVVQRYKSTCRQCVNTGPAKRKDNIDPKQCIKCGIIKPCLLYTSPSPRDRISSRMPSSA